MKLQLNAFQVEHKFSKLVLVVCGCFLAALTKLSFSRRRRLTEKSARFDAQNARKTR